MQYECTKVRESVMPYPSEGGYEGPKELLLDGMTVGEYLVRREFYGPVGAQVGTYSEVAGIGLDKLFDDEDMVGGHSMPYCTRTLEYAEEYSAHMSSDLEEYSLMENDLGDNSLFTL